MTCGALVAMGARWRFGYEYVYICIDLGGFESWSYALRQDLGMCKPSGTYGIGHSQSQQCIASLQDMFFRWGAILSILISGFRSQRALPHADVSSLS